MTKQFPKEEERKKYKDCVLIERANDGYILTTQFRNLLVANNDFYKMVIDIIEYDTTTKTLPVFINYNKAEDAIAYEDRFVTPDNLIALSKHPRKVTSSDADYFYKRTEADKDNKILLFVRKNKDDNEAKEFYFLGEMYAQNEPTPIIMPKTNDDAFEINYRLDVPVREDIYDYLVGVAQ